MSELAQQLKSSFAMLSMEDRVELTYFLLDSLTEDDDPKWREAWEAELVRREGEVASGEARYVSADEVFRRSPQRKQGTSW